MSDRHDNEGAYSENPPKAPKRSWDRHDEADEAQEALPSLGKGAGGSLLGNLAQAAREKQIHTARNLLFLVGVLQTGFSIFQMVIARGQVDDELRKAGAQPLGAQEMQIVMAVVYLVGGMFLAAGLAFLVLGAFVKKFPLTCTILGLVLFILINIIAAVLEPKSLLSGWIIKVIFLVGLVKAIQAAAAYQREEAPSET